MSKYSMETNRLGTYCTYCTETFTEYFVRTVFFCASFSEILTNIISLSFEGEW